MDYISGALVENLKIAVAQISSLKGDVESNIKTHLLAINKACELNVAYIVFPELSLIGYEPEIAKDLAFTYDDKRLTPLIDAAIQNNIQIGVGAPIETSGLPKIGLFVISPSGSVEIYEKIHLHAGEEKYFDRGSQHHFVNINDQKIANAICADTNNPQHANTCSELGSSIYIAGVFITEGGYLSDTAVMADYAKKYNILVAMANYHSHLSQTSTGMIPIGKSAIWSQDGLLASAPETQSAIVVAERLNEQWHAQVFKI